MAQKSQAALQGTMGQFGVDLANFIGTSNYWPGHAERKGKRYSIRTIKKSSELSGAISSLADPEYIVGLTEVGGIIAYDVLTASNQSVYGGSRISVRSYSARGFVVVSEISQLRSVMLESMTTRYHGLARWGQLKTSQLETKHHPDGRAKEFSYTVTNTPPEVGRTANGINVELGVSWSFREKRLDEFTAATPLSFKVHGPAPMSWQDLLKPMRAFQDLLSLAFVAFMPCVDGSATPDYKEAADGGSCEFWSGDLMDIPTGVKVVGDALETPVFSLASIGGVPGVCRWIDLAEEHPRAVGPLTSDQRHGVKTVEVELLNIAVAIEYWVAACKKAKGSVSRPQWTKAGVNAADTLAIHVGGKFEEFVGGNLTKWASLFWNRYNTLKHDPSAAYDAYEIYTLMRGARVLLMCALTRSVSGNDAPVEMICDSNQFYNLGIQTRELVFSSPPLNTH